MFDKLLSVAGAFDWITPTIAFVQDFYYGPISDFGIPSNSSWSASDIKRLLKRNGVHVWGLMFDLSGDMIMFTVRKTQAKWTYYLLDREGVPILYAPDDAVNSQPRNRKKKTNLTDPFESISTVLDKISNSY